MAADEAGFWAFSTGLYTRPGVEAALLALQDEDGLDVSLVLFCLYAASRGETVDEELAGAMIAIGESWGRRVVAPLRAARRELKTLAPDSAVRVDVKRLELAAEKEMQAALDALLPTGAELEAPGDRRALAERNLRVWLSARHLALSGSPRRARLAAVVEQAFP